VVPAALLLAAVMVGACSSGGGDSESAPTTTTSTVPVTSTTSAAQAAGVVPIDGTGDQHVSVPASINGPAIVHARYDDSGVFTVAGVDAQNKRTQTLVASKGGYDGTFPVGFDASVAMQVHAVGPWHLDIGSATLAPRVAGGTTGTGDVVFSYTGPAKKVDVRHQSASRFVLRVYANAAIVVLVDQSAPLSTQATLPAGPAFVWVSTTGPWSIIPVK
jgi:hypothetical protein